MKWFTELHSDVQVFVSMLFVFVIFIMFASIGTVIETSNKHEIQEKAIEAGLHQEVIDGHVLWVK